MIENSDVDDHESIITLSGANGTSGSMEREELPLSIPGSQEIEQFNYPQNLRKLVLAPTKKGESLGVFKTLRAKIHDPCYKILPVALWKYNINAPWGEYDLYIRCYGEKERRLELYEKPLVIFKQLEKEGKTAVFMLKKLSAERLKTESLLRTGEWVSSAEANW